MKRIEIIPIAKRKADRRGINKEWIEDAVMNPVQVVDGYGVEKLHTKSFS
jgi:hypothetical protein